MLHWPIMLAFGLILSLSAMAAPVCAPVMSLEDVRTIVNQTKEQFFPELIHTDVILKTFRAKAYYLQAQPLKASLLGARKNRTYAVMVNPKLLLCPPSPEALTAIVIHELEHVKDYEQWSSLKIAGFSLHYGLSPSMRATYERQTDRRALEKGVHEGLAQYREWIYQWLTPRQLQRKKRFYLTPEEIRSSSK